MANVSPEVGVVRYELVCLLVNSGCEDVQLEYGFDGFYHHSLHHQHKQHHATTQNTSNVFTMFALAWYHGFCFGFRHAEIDAEIHPFVSNEYSRLCWPHFYLGPRDSDGERERERHTQRRERERERDREIEIFPLGWMVRYKKFFFCESWL